MEHGHNAGQIPLPQHGRDLQAKKNILGADQNYFFIDRPLVFERFFNRGIDLMVRDDFPIGFMRHVFRTHREHAGGIGAGVKDFIVAADDHDPFDHAGKDGIEFIFIMKRLLLLLGKPAG